MSQRVFISGFGIITSIGKNTSENLQSLINAKTGYGKLDFLETAYSKTLPACEVKLSDAELYSRANIPFHEGFTRTTLLGVIALKEAVQSSNLSEDDLKNSGLISATTTGGIRELEKYFEELTDENAHGGFTKYIDTANPGEHCERLADYFRIKKYIGTISTACSSSANALMYGAELIKNRKLNRVICGGTEALSKFTLNGFNTLRITDEQHCRPFDSTRNGLNLGEGAAYLVLESEDEIKKRNAKPLAELTGYGNANDAFHPTASSPDGVGAYLAMKAALESAKMSFDKIDYINTHGTATENNDLAEGSSIQKLFEQVPMFSSTKPYTGHALAAAASIEAVFSILAIQQKMVWPSLNFTTPMPELPIVPVKSLQQNMNMRHVMSNSFGFGGNTSSLIISSVNS